MNRKSQLIEALNSELELNTALVKMRISSVRYFDRSSDQDEEYCERYNRALSLVERAVQTLDDMQSDLMIDVKSEGSDVNA